MHFSQNLKNNMCDIQIWKGYICDIELNRGVSMCMSIKKSGFTSQVLISMLSCNGTIFHRVQFLIQNFISKLNETWYGIHVIYI